MTKQKGLQKIRKLKRLTKDLSPEGWKLLSAEMDTYDQNFMREYADKIQWEFLSIGSRLKESFLREVEKYVDWTNICTWTNLSKDFIREYKDKLNWFQISRWQKIDQDFIREFRDQIDVGMLSLNEKISSKLWNEWVIKGYIEEYEII